MKPSDSYGPTKGSIEPSEADFNAMLLRNKAMLWHVCSDYKLGKEWSPEDCMQEVMVNLWRSYGSFEGRSSEKTWVWRVATNTMLMLRRKSNKSLDTIPFGDNESEVLEEQGNESQKQLQQLIDALPEKDAIAIRATLDGFSYKEIAEMTDSSVGAVAMRIARTKRRLKKLYEQENNR